MRTVDGKFFVERAAEDEGNPLFVDGAMGAQAVARETGRIMVRASRTHK